MIADNLRGIINELPSDVKLAAVSKFHPVATLMEAYSAGQRVFAESRPQELAAKVPLMPPDTEWHFIGHLQTNKLKFVLPLVSLVQSVDSFHLLEAIDAWGIAHSKRCEVLLEQHIASEETKQGFHVDEICRIFDRRSGFAGLSVKGLMAMASNTGDTAVIRREFTAVRALFDSLHSKDASFEVLSIGMSSDWRVAVECGSTMIRVGTAIFGPREY